MAAESDFEGVQSGAKVSAAAGDGYGTIARSLGVPMTKLIPPIKSKLSRLTGLEYTSGSTAHTVVAMVTLGDVTPTLTQDVAVNGTVLYISEPVYDSTAGVPASLDWVVVRDANGDARHFRVASYAANAITITVTQYYGDANGTGVPVALPEGNKVWFLGSPTADHPNRQFPTLATTLRTKTGILATSPKV